MSKPADFRAALYCGICRLNVINDVDFQNDTFIPIGHGDEHDITLRGGSHVLNNVTIKMEKCDNVGLIARGYVSNIVVKNGSVKGRSYVGGIVGNGGATECGFEGNIEASGDYVGGIVGSLSQNVNKCYHVGNVIGNNYVGGVTGFSLGTSSSYNIGNVTGIASEFIIVGGVNGYGGAQYCYSYGNISSGYGITGSGSAYYSLTSAPRLNGADGNSAYTNFGPSKTFVSLLSVINGEEAYSTQTWANIDAGCPLLRWQADTFGAFILYFVTLHSS